MTLWGFAPSLVTKRRLAVGIALERQTYKPGDDTACGRAAQSFSGALMIIFLWASESCSPICVVRRRNLSVAGRSFFWSLESCGGKTCVSGWCSLSVARQSFFWSLKSRGSTTCVIGRRNLSVAG